MTILQLTYHRTKLDILNAKLKKAKELKDTELASKLYNKIYKTGKVIEWLNQRPA